MAHFLNERRQEQRDDFGPMTQNVDGSKHAARFDPVPPNTNYTVHVKAETRTQHGHHTTASCRMEASVPGKENLMSVSLMRYHKSAEQWGLRLNMPRVPERRGPVCCYSVVLVKMLEGKSISTLPEPSSLPLLTYEEVHRQGAGAYIAELFDADRFPVDGVALGDGSLIDKSNPPCRSCPGIFWPKPSGVHLEQPEERLARRSSLEPPSNMISLDLLSVDGPLSPESNYTTFVRVRHVTVGFLSGYP